jgi:hypothetical protein
MFSWDAIGYIILRSNPEETRDDTYIERKKNIVCCVRKCNGNKKNKQSTLQSEGEKKNS